MEKQIIRILEENTNILTIDSIKFFYSKIIFPNPVNHKEFEETLNKLLEKGAVEKSGCGEFYYSLK